VPRVYMVEPLAFSASSGAAARRLCVGQRGRAQSFRAVDKGMTGTHARLPWALAITRDPTLLAAGAPALSSHPR